MLLTYLRFLTHGDEDPHVDARVRREPDWRLAGRRDRDGRDREENHSLLVRYFINMNEKSVAKLIELVQKRLITIEDISSILISMRDNGKKVKV